MQLMQQSVLILEGALILEDAGDHLEGVLVAVVVVGLVSANFCGCQLFFCFVYPVHPRKHKVRLN
jgi:hypothetical protein